MINQMCRPFGRCRSVPSPTPGDF